MHCVHERSATRGAVRKGKPQSTKLSCSWVLTASRRRFHSCNRVARLKRRTKYSETFLQCRVNLIDSLNILRMVRKKICGALHAIGECSTYFDHPEFFIALFILSTRDSLASIDMRPGFHPATFASAVKRHNTTAAALLCRTSKSLRFWSH